MSAARSDARLARVAVIGAAVFCLADWMLVEDLGFLGGLGTDPEQHDPADPAVHRRVPGAQSAAGG